MFPGQAYESVVNFIGKEVAEIEVEGRKGFCHLVNLFIFDCEWELAGNDKLLAFELSCLNWENEAVSLEDEAQLMHSDATLGQRLYRVFPTSSEDVQICNAVFLKFQNLIVFDIFCILAAELHHILHCCHEPSWIEDDQVTEFFVVFIFVQEEAREKFCNKKNKPSSWYTCR